MNTSEQFLENNEQAPKLKIGEAVVYSSRIQEAMRHNRLSSSDYHLAMTIMRAVAQGHTEEQWKEEQQRSLKLLINQPASQEKAHADAADGYEQTVSNLKDMELWPW